MNNNLREITEKALSGLIGIIAGVIIFFCFIYPLIIKIAKVYNGHK